MIHRIEVGLKPQVKDVQGDMIAQKSKKFLDLDLNSIKTAQVFLLNMEISANALEELAAHVLVDPVIHHSSLDEPLWADSADWLLEIGLQPGVTDNVGRTTREVLEVYLGRQLRPEEGVYTACQYWIEGDLNSGQVEELADKLIANRLIQRWKVILCSSLKSDYQHLYQVPRVHIDPFPVEEIPLEVGAQELQNLSRQRMLALSVEEMEAIRNYYRQEEVQAFRAQKSLPPNPTDVELEMLAQTWSEHCKHKIFNARITFRDEKGEEQVIESLFDTYIRAATREVRRQRGDDDFCLSVFSDNAGVISFDGKHSLVFKVETHNSPSALDPYGGALTGIVGVNRDPLGTGMGAKLIFNTDIFCFADPFFSGSLPDRLLHPRRILDGVREGVEHGGNKSGIPTVNGSVVFDRRYLGKPLVFCGTGGIMPRQVGGKPSHLKRVDKGDLIVMVGGRIGKDGIHGATFSSEELHQGSPQTAVQIGDPITQKRMSDFILKARDMGLYNFITDNGAGGLSSSVGETAEFCGGCDLDLKAAPLKYEGLASWEILVSEAQERMNLAVPPDKINDFLELAGQMDVEATVLGDFNDNGYLQIRYGEDIVGLMEMEFLHQGVPRLELTARWCLPTLEEPSIPMPADCGAELHALLARLNICSKEYFVRQYDHEVQARSVIKPLMGAENDGPSDAAVIRIDLDSNQGLAVSHGICPRYSDLDSYWMAANALDEAVRNALAVGANPDYMAALDNFCWCDPVVSENNPQGEYKLAQLVRANQALYKGAVAYSIPLISGKDSMKNDYISESGERISIPPTLLISLVGEIPVLEKAVSMDFKKAGDLIYLVGETKEEMGGSEYFLHHNQHGGQVPRVDFQKNIGMYRALHQLMLEGRVLSCHDCSDGGLAVALAECCLAGNLGAEIDLSASIPDGFRDDFYLFSESAGRLVITLRPWNSCKAERLLKGFPCVQIGEVRREKKMQIKGSDGRILLKEKVLDLKQSWQRTLRFGEDK